MGKKISLTHFILFNMSLFGFFLILHHQCHYGFISLKNWWVEWDSMSVFFKKSFNGLNQIPFLGSLVCLELGLNLYLPGHWWTLSSTDQWTSYIYIYFNCYYYFAMYTNVWYSSLKLCLFCSVDPFSYSIIDLLNYNRL